MNPNTQRLHQVLSSAVRWPSSEAEHWVLSFVGRACDHDPVAALVLFGSAIRPVRAVGDIDVLVVHSGLRPQFEQPPIDVDVRLYSEVDVDKLLAEGHELLGWALRLGRLICERDDYWSLLQKRWLPQLPFPSPSDAEERARKSQQLFQDLSRIGDEDAALEQLVSMLTYRARAALLRSGVYPASRPELPGQLLSIGEASLAHELRASMERRNDMVHGKVAARRPK